MLNIDIKQAATCFPDLLQKTIEGNEVLITQNGQPIVKLIDVRKKRKKKRQFGSAKGLIKMADDFDATPEDFQDYMR
ncbi:MAG: type II toxin-antitoxin system Phd/YefM family antitoxin [Desulfamplus sp.]|nr:type II toxin-antitoxin system prevent-host-death family antitoxin [Desulfamplus sp.]